MNGIASPLVAENDIRELDQHVRLEVGGKRRGGGEGQQADKQGLENQFLS
jgi:hypothetical protein